MHKTILYASVMVLLATLAASSALGLSTVYGQQQQQLLQQQVQQQQLKQQQLSVGPEEEGDRHPNLPPPIGFPFTNAGNVSFGDIASIQNNESGQPAWILVGHWRGNLLSFNQTASNNNNANTSTTNNTTTTPKVVFNADFKMIMLNGSASHSHVITNFNASKILSSSSNGTKTFIGTSTVSLREGPQTGVPTIIKISGQIISILPDPSSVHHHFGDTPIYGIIEQRHQNERQESQGQINNEMMMTHH